MTGHPLLSRGGSRGRSGFHPHRSLSSRARAAGKGPKAARPQGLQGSWDLPVHAADPLRRLHHRPEWAGGHGRGGGGDLARPDLASPSTEQRPPFRAQPRSPGTFWRLRPQEPRPQRRPRPPASRSGACAAAPSRFPESLIDRPLPSRRSSALPPSRSARWGAPLLPAEDFLVSFYGREPWQRS